MKNNVITFGDKDYLVVDEFEHEGKKYLYIIENELKNDIELTYIVKTEDDCYETVMDENLFKVLSLIEAKRALLRKVKNEE